VVDEGRATRLLRGIAERADRLRTAAAVAGGERPELWLDGVKYLFVTMIEGCLDVAQHIASSERLGVPDSNAGAIRLLGRAGVIEQPLAEALGRAAGFRNVLVHGYAEVDDSIVMESLETLHDFDDFVAQVSAWIDERRIG
jgi:uncharacterized protein YutE (UPF0331/DUF86 family)